MDTTRPSAYNTGLAVEGLTDDDLTLISGNQTINTSGTVWDKKLIRGIVDIPAGVSNVTIKNCKLVSCYQPTVAWDAVIRSSGTNVLIENCEITEYDDTQNPAVDNSVWYMVGVKVRGGTATIKRCNIHDVIDTTYVTGGTMEVAGNHFHDFQFRTDFQDAADKNPPYWSHNDGVQIMAGSNHYVHGNNFDMRYSQVTGMASTLTGDPQNFHGMLVQGNYSTVTGVRIEYNWFAYGDICILYSGNNYTGNTASMLGNRFTPDQYIEFSFYKQMQNNPNSYWTVTGAETTVYSDDPDTPEEWRGQPIKPPVYAANNTQTTWYFNKDAHTP